MTTSRKSRILQEVHETAEGLHGTGLISKRRMGEFDALCHLDVAAMSPQKRSGASGRKRASARRSLPPC